MLSDGFPRETLCNPQLKLKVTKITLVAFSVKIKNVLKLYRNRVWHRDFRMQLYYSSLL